MRRLVVVVLLAGCSGRAFDGSTDAGGGTEVGAEASIEAEASIDTGRADAITETGIQCPPSQHDCGGTCVDTSPENGCSGCSPCVAPEHASATCTPDGACDFECQDVCTKVGMGCECPGPPPCCSNADCPSSAPYCYDGTCFPTLTEAHCVEVSCWGLCSYCANNSKGGHCQPEGISPTCFCEVW